MGTNYPESVDSFSVPGLPASTTLSSSGTSTRTHTQNHLDLGEAVEALEANAAQLDHDHSGGDGTFATQPLDQVNTHGNIDTDQGVASAHHTLGPSATQAAPGNHIHDYNGSSIINKPYILCTSTTRPFDPVPGLMIWETDTNCVRAWANFGQDDILNQGINYTYGFNTNNSGSHLDTALFTTTYVTGVSPGDYGVTFSGSSPTIGSMGAATVGQAAWVTGTNVNARAIARAIVSGNATTDTDDQVLSFTTGSTHLVTTNDLGLELHDSGITSPANDAYLRMSVDEQSYVRFQINGFGASIWYTTSGPANETFLGSGVATTEASGVVWTAKAIGNAYLFYANNELVVGVTDNSNSVNIGASYRGWGIGMVAAHSLVSQLVPNSISSVTIGDQPFYTSGGIWQLLPVGKVPHVRAEAHFRQQVVVGDPGGIVGFDTVLYDWNPYPFFSVETSQTDITVRESGHYNVHAAIVWDGSYNAFDHAMIGITVNGLDIGRKHWEFMRGNGFAPGFNQVQECHFTYYFAAGDILRIQAQHNASSIQWLNYIGTSPNIQTNWVEIDFMGA